MATKVIGSHFKILSQGINHFCNTDAGKEKTYWSIFMKQITGKKWHRLIFLSCFRNSSSFISRVLTHPNISEMSFCFLCSLVFKSLRWWPISHTDAKSKNHFSSPSSARTLPFSFMNASVSNLNAENIYFNSVPQFSHRTFVWYKTSS